VDGLVAPTATHDENTMPAINEQKLLHFISYFEWQFLPVTATPDTMSSSHGLSVVVGHLGGKGLHCPEKEPRENPQLKIRSGAHPRRPLPSSPN